MNDFAELLSRAKQGDEDAQDQLLALAQDRILGQVRARIGPGLRRELESVDVQQSVLKDAVRDLPQLRGEDEKALWGWLGQLVENKLRKKARDAGRLKRDGGPQVRLDETTPSGAPAIEPQGRDATPSVVVQTAEEVARVHAALARLPEHYARVFELRTIDGLGWAEVAERTGQTVKAAQGVFARAQARLATELGAGSDDARSDGA